MLTTEEHEIVDEAEEAIARAEDVYQRGGHLVTVIQEQSKLAAVRASASPKIVELPIARLRTLLAQHAEFVKIVYKKDKHSGLSLAVDEAPAHPPDWAVKGLHALGNWPNVRRLEQVIEVPVIRPDGTVLTTPGHDAATGLLFLPNADFLPVPEHPTKTEARAAADRLLDLVADFPFATDAHASAWLASAISPFARYAYKGPTPAFLFDANTRSAGKSLLSDLVSAIYAGRSMARMAQAPHEDEERKRIMTFATSGEPLVLIDNVDREFGSGTFDSMITGEDWSDRVLGKMSGARVPLLICWYATGNNIRFNAQCDTARRCIHIRLEAKEENPEHRSNFRHKLPGHAFEHRAEYVRDVLTILRHYFDAGKPDLRLKVMGSYQAWSAVVRTSLVLLGLPDPYDTNEELTRIADTSANALADLLEGWIEVVGTKAATVQEVLRALADDNDRIAYGGREQYPRLRAALAELLPTSHGQLPKSKSLGMKLHHHRGRVCGGLRIVREEDARAGAQWRVERLVPSSPASSPATANRSDSLANPPKSGTSGTSFIKQDQEKIRGTDSVSPASTGSEKGPASPASPADPSPAPPPVQIGLGEHAAKVARDAETPSPAPPPRVCGRCGDVLPYHRNTCPAVTGGAP